MEGSWRTGVPQQVQDDLDDCFSFALDVALELVRNAASSAPFGASVDAAGQVSIYDLVINTPTPTRQRRPPI